MSSDGKRAARVGEQIKEELMSLIIRGELRHPMAPNIVVSDVRLSSDLRHARVYVRTLSAHADAMEQRAAVSAMKKASGYLRREIGRRLTLKHTPELRFYWDEGIDHALRMETLLSEIRKEEESSATSNDADHDAPAGTGDAADDGVGPQ